MQRYRLKTDDRIKCEAELVPGTRGRQSWYKVGYNDERLHGYTFSVPAEIFEASWAPIDPAETSPIAEAAPTQDEIDRVTAWQKNERLSRVIAELEEYADEGRKAFFRGIPVDERFSRKALVGLVLLTTRLG